VSPSGLVGMLFQLCGAPHLRCTILEFLLLPLLHRHLPHSDLHQIQRALFGLDLLVQRLPPLLKPLQLTPQLPLQLDQPLERGIGHGHLHSAGTEDRRQSLQGHSSDA
jgi:hypothetical protein